MSILASISTRGRYDTTLPLAISSVIAQTKKPDHLIIFDDNNEPIDLRNNQTYAYLFSMLDRVGISWSVEFGQRRGQHFNHQRANLMGFDWVWRLDDDNIAEPNVLETLCGNTNSQIGAIGGSILVPTWDCTPKSVTGNIEYIYSEPNVQWGYIQNVQKVDHLHCSFLYRAGIVDYNLGLSKKAHREETLHTWQLTQKGYKNLVIPDCITWHLRNSEGGIRSDDNEQDYAHDEDIFHNFLEYKDKTIVVLDCGMGDHIVFKHILPFIKNPVVFSCYPEIIPGDSIERAKMLFGDLDQWNIYKKMDQWHWTDSLENAYRRMYL